MRTPPTPPTRASRRRFLKHAAAGALLGAAPVFSSRAAGANERLSVGLIGAGDRGSQLLQEIQGLAGSQEVEVTAVCDVWRVNLSRAAARIKERSGAEPRAGTRFRDTLALSGLDAVVIATPDFAHAPILLAALEAGKDVYAEKPMTTDLAAAAAALDLARSKARVVQCGTQFRSHGGYIAAARELSKGVLGTLSRISAASHFNEQRWTRPYDDCKEADVDWEAYLLGRPARPFDPRLLRRWQTRRECTDGLPGLWMSHYADAVHLMTGAKHPSRAVSLGGVYVWKDGREHPDTFHTLLEYPEGFLFDWAMSLGNSAGCHFTVHGTRGTLELSRSYMDPGVLALSAEGGSAKDKLEPRKLLPEPGASHMANWIECVRSRGRPNADIEHGFAHMVAVTLAARALETGRRQVYDPTKREVSVA
ncbi:MAG: Gfo/Idh/MocA family oxidoreductase [Planctomycetes bacterium]|nr:Gfo/Idh/MocA family oxidoreductase [Planctomycetota bacterium]